MSIEDKLAIHEIIARYSHTYDGLDEHLATIDDYPRGHRSLLLRKRLDVAG
jgi:hypothetical protein